jgi:N6-L-threonylcarbamoyladenine synthase
MKKYPTILAIDTSCDDTSAAVTQGVKVLSNIIASQEEMHRKYGGVMPLVAKLAHHELIHPTYQESLKRAGMKESQIDAIAVTQGPGLAIALEVGIAYAQETARQLNKPLIATNHMAGHMFSSLAVSKNRSPAPKLNKKNFPVLAFLVSGGHTELVLIEDFDNYKIIGQTLDDAAGECLDKFARMLDLGYPGAATMEILARSGDPDKFQFPLPMPSNKHLDMSFSGLKTAGLHQIQQLGNLSKKDVQNLAASFQKAVIRALIYKLEKALAKYPVKTLLLGGGVVNNLKFRQAVRKVAGKHKLSAHFPYSKKLINDNAAMIGVAAYFQYLQNDFVQDETKLDRIPRMNL